MSRRFLASGLFVPVMLILIVLLVSPAEADASSLRLQNEKDGIVLSLYPEEGTKFCLIEKKTSSGEWKECCSEEVSGKLFSWKDRNAKTEGRAYAYRITLLNGGGEVMETETKSLLRLGAPDAPDVSPFEKEGEKGFFVRTQMPEDFFGCQIAVSSQKDFFCDDHEYFCRASGRNIVKEISGWSRGPLYVRVRFCKAEGKRITWSAWSGSSVVSV